MIPAVDPWAGHEYRLSLAAEDGQSEPSPSPSESRSFPLCRRSLRTQRLTGRYDTYVSVDADQRAVVLTLASSRRGLATVRASRFAVNLRAVAILGSGTKNSNDACRADKQRENGVHECRREVHGGSKGVVVAYDRLKVSYIYSR